MKPHAKGLPLPPSGTGSVERQERIEALEAEATKLWNAVRVLGRQLDAANRRIAQLEHEDVLVLEPPNYDREIL